VFEERVLADMLAAWSQTIRRVLADMLAAWSQTIRFIAPGKW
jgi:hypothetical protein